MSNLHSVEAACKKVGLNSIITSQKNEILNSKKKISLDIDNQLLRPPQFQLSYDEYDNLEINKKCVKFFKKIS